MTGIETVSTVLIAGGVLLGVVSAVGLNRFEGVLMRTHAASKPQVVGLILVFAGAALAAGSWALAGLLLVVLLAQMLTVPAASIMVGRAAFRRGFVRGSDYAIDELSPRLAESLDEDEDEDGFVDDLGDDHEGMADGDQDRFPENIVVVTTEPLTGHNWEEPESGADEGEDEDAFDIDLKDETELEADAVAERDARP